MEYEKATLKIEKEDVLLVKPSKSTPSCILSLSTLDNKGANNNIVQTVHVYRSSSAIQDYDSSFNPCHIFKEALSKALFYYYPLAGIRVFFMGNNDLVPKCLTTSYIVLQCIEISKKF